MAVPPSILRGRILRTTYLYEDPATPERASASVVTPQWTPDDRSLLLGLEMYEATLCPGGCGQPRESAWHADAEGEYDAVSWVCHACTAKQGTQVVFSTLVEIPSAEKVARFLPFDLVNTTTEPTKQEGDQ